MRNTNQQSLGEVIKELLETYRLQDGVFSARINDIWAIKMDKVIVARTLKISYYKGTLTVVLNSSVIRQELDYKKKEVIEIMNLALGENVINEIVLK